MLNQEQRDFILENVTRVDESPSGDLLNNTRAMLSVCVQVFGEELCFEGDDDPKLDYVRLSMAEQIIEILDR